MTKTTGCFYVRIFLKEYCRTLPHGFSTEPSFRKKKMFLFYVGYDCPCQGWGINRELKIRYKPGFWQLLETIPFSEKIYLLCPRSISSIADEVYLLLPMKYILEISDSFYARDNECKHSLSSRLTKEFFEKYYCPRKSRPCKGRYRLA